MKNTIYFILLATLTLGLGTNMAMAQDLAKLSPQDVKILFENDRVRMLEVRHQPGVKEPMHSHPAYMTYYLDAATMKITSPDGKTVVKDRKAGEVAWGEPVTHALENIGTTEQHVLVIELKK